MKPRSKSKEWIHFAKSSCRKLVTCSISKKTLNFFENTTNIYKHLKLHPDVLQEVQEKTSESLGTHAHPKRNECVESHDDLTIAKCNKQLKLTG